MSNPARFLTTDKRLNAAEFAARIYPEKTRPTATRALNRHLHSGIDSPEAQAARDAAREQVQQLATDLRTGLAKHATGWEAQTRHLAALAGDKRLVQAQVATTLFHEYPPGTAKSFWTKVRNDSYVLLPREAERLRTELAALATACEKATK